jgi:hypothetical protein
MTILVYDQKVWDDVSVRTGHLKNMMYADFVAVRIGVDAFSVKKNRLDGTRDYTISKVQLLTAINRVNDSTEKRFKEKEKE